MSNDHNNRTYANENITVFWKPALCTHCEACITGLPEVFDLNKRPWINIDGADDKRIVEQVKQCPSGALTHQWNEIQT